MVESKNPDSRYLPLGSCSFAEIRDWHKIYVDKTACFADLAAVPGYYILTRPRRFGKTLLVSTFESLFKEGLKRFKGLAIEKTWTDPATYPVIKLDFTACRTFKDVEEFSLKFEDMLSKAVLLSGFKYPEPDQSLGSFGKLDLFELLLAQSDDYPVLLIDEYDAPLNDCLNDEKLFDEVSRVLRAFYDMVKRQSGKLRFLFVTGICRFQNLGLFSGVNNLTDLSMDQAYGTLLGYTEKEIRQYFSPYVERNAEFLGLSFDECLLQMKRLYDGFCFDEDGATHVFNPWSVLSFLAKATPKFENFWYETAGNSTVLLNYLKSHSLKDPSDYGKDQIVSKNELASCRSLSELNDVALLILTGYLTIKEKLSDRVFLVNYPNEEVASSMAQLYGEKLCSQEQSQNLLLAFKKQAPEEIFKCLNALLLSIPYQNYPISNESELRTILGLVLKGCGFKCTYFENSNALGRSDIEVDALNRYFVIELKYAREGDDPEKLLKIAVEQIKTKHYGEQNSPELPHIRMALVFSKKERCFVASEIF